MLPSRFFNDLMLVWATLTVSAILGLTLNEMRSRPLPLIYSPPTVVLNQAVENLKGADLPVSNLDSDVSRIEMLNIVSTHSALILDARPDIFYRLGHIPTAWSLPRDDFENRYRILQDQLAPHRGKPVIVYCEGNDCHDSQMVAEALQRLGFHVRVFRGGWTEWKSTNLPEEKG